jgi:DNA polymerase I-like protein with 3'-5' exonuclease and polymerase domains
MLQWALDEGCILVGWNVVFDIAWLYAYAENDTEVFRLLEQAHFLDAMLLWRHLDIEPEYDHKQQRSYSLKTAVPLFFPKYAGYEAEVAFHTTDPEQLTKLHEYNIKDCVFTLRLAGKFWRGLAHSQQAAAIIEAASFKMIARANLEGLIVDTLEAGFLSANLKHVAAMQLASLAPHGITEKIVRSPRQLGALLFGQWKLPSLDVTPTGAHSTSKVVLHKLALRDKRVGGIRTYREALNNNTKFAVAPLAACTYNGDQRAHPQARVFGTYSGRMTFSSKQGKNKGERQTGFALHQMKRDPLFRRIIVPPPGFTLMEFDVAGQEYRWMAIASGDATMLDLCRAGQDPHAYMGSRIDRTMTYKQIMANAKVPGSPEANARQCGKVCNLASNYRVGYKKFQQVAEVDYGISLSLEEAQRIQRVYLATYPGVPKYWRAQIDSAQVNGYVTTFAGRRVKLVGDWNGDLSWQMGGTAINYRIQGCLQRGTRVLTMGGLVPVEELVGVACTVWTGFCWAPAAGMNRGPCQLAEVTLASGEVIRCDTRHKLKGVDREWIDFADLKVGALVALPRLTAVLNPSADVTWPYVMGVYIGDGWLTRRTRDNGWTRCNFGIVGGVTKLVNLERIQKFLASEGIEARLNQRKPTVWTLECSTRACTELLIELGLTPNLTSRTKRIPEVVWRMSLQDQRDFFEGISDSDGSKVKGQERNLHTPNKALLSDLQVLVSALGFDAKIASTHDAYLLRISSKGYRDYPKDCLLADLDGFIPPCRMGDCESIVDRRAVIGDQKVMQRVAERIYDQWLPDLEVYRMAAITDIKTLDTVEDTYTLSVDDDLHQFVADGVVHKNTGADQKYLALRCVRGYLNEIGARFAWDLHDGLYFYVPTPKVRDAAYRLKDLLDNLPYEAMWGFKPPIALPWDCKVGMSWGNLVSFKFEED